MYACYMTGMIYQQELSLALLVSNGPLAIGTALHEIAQVNAAQAISEQFGPAVLESKMGNTSKEADIVAAGQVWEVKPLGGESPESQLRDYTALGGLDRGNNTVLSKEKPIDISIIGNIRMEVTFGDPGEIFYECYKYRDDGERVDVPNWQVWWEFEWRKDLLELSAAAVVAAAVLAPEVVLPAVGTGALDYLYGY